MSDLSDSVRRFWLPGLHLETGRPDDQGIRGWIQQGTFQVHAPLTNTGRLAFADQSEVCGALAGDVVRASVAALETVASISPVRSLPKSKPWAIVQWYYAAFFSVHSILGMCGTAVVRLDGSEAATLARIATLFGHSCTAAAGLYSLRVDADAREIVLSPHGGRGGSHEFLWKIFHEWLVFAASELRASASGARDTAAADYLDDVRAVLCTAPAQTGCWLSHLRNQVNYRQQLGTWFPYADHHETDLVAFSGVRGIRTDLAGAAPLPLTGRPLQKFVQTCRFLVQVAREMALDMQSRCPQPSRSFHKYGVARFEALTG